MLDSQTFCTRYIAHSRRLHALATRLTGDSDAADDIVQDVYTRLWQMRDDLPVDASGLLVTMTRHRAIDYLRRQQARMGDSPADDTDITADDGIDEELEQRERLATTLRLVDRLPADQRRVLRLRAVDEMDYNQIARATGFTAANVRVLLCRARQRLRQLALKNNIL